MALRTAALAAPLAVALLALAAPAGLAKTLHVPSDDFPGIQAAVDASSDGDTILVGAGTYSSSVTISGKTKLTIRGVPESVIDSSTFSLDGCEKVTLDGLSFVDATDTQNAVSAVDCPGLALKNLRVEGYDGDAILLDNCDGARVSKCTVVDGPGVGLHNIGSLDLVVEKSTFTGNAGWAIELSLGDESGSDRARVSKNTVTGPAYGITADGTDLRIEGNTVTLVEGPGIQVGTTFDAAGALVQKNTVSTTGNSYQGLYVGGTSTRVAKNSVTGGVGVGLMVVGAGSRIEGNREMGATVQGIHCGGDDLRIVGNLAQGQASQSFHISEGSRSLVSKNRALDAGNASYFVSQPDAVLTKNLAEGGSAGFELHAIPMTLTANVATGNSYTDVISEFSESQFVLVRNRFATFIWDNPVNPI